MLCRVDGTLVHKEPKVQMGRFAAFGQGRAADESDHVALVHLLSRPFVCSMVTT